MIAALYQILRHFFNRASSVAQNETGPSEAKALKDPGPLVTVESSSRETLDPYDECLLERARIQWQFGDWPSLAELELDNLQNHPDLGELALLVLAGRLQIGKTIDAKAYIRIAEDCGLSKLLIGKILIAGVHNSIGRAYLIKGENKLALNHLEDAICMVEKNSDRNRSLFSEARAVREAIQLGLLPQASRLMDIKTKKVEPSSRRDKARDQVLETEVELWRHEFSLAREGKSTFPPKQGINTEHSDHSDTFNMQLRINSFLQINHDLPAPEKNIYKFYGYFSEFLSSNGLLIGNTFIMENEFGWYDICAKTSPDFFKNFEQESQLHCFASPYWSNNWPAS